MSTEISIKQLPQVTEINNDDLILVQTPNATNTLLFSIFVIGLDNTTFGSTITQNSTDIETLSSEVNSLSSTLTTDINTLSTNLDTLSGVLYGTTQAAAGDSTHGLSITIDGVSYIIMLSAT